MSATAYKRLLVRYVTTEVKEALQGRGNLSRDDLEYVVAKVATLRDERLKQCITELIGWGDEQRAGLETTFAILIKIMADANPSKIRKAAENTELRHHFKTLVEDMKTVEEATNE